MNFAEISILYNLGLAGILFPKEIYFWSTIIACSSTNVHSCTVVQQCYLFGRFGLATLPTASMVIKMRLCQPRDAAPAELRKSVMWEFLWPGGLASRLREWRQEHWVLISSWRKFCAFSMLSIRVYYGKQTSQLGIVYIYYSLSFSWYMGILLDTDKGTSIKEFHYRVRKKLRSRLLGQWFSNFVIH